MKGAMFVFNPVKGDSRVLRMASIMRRVTREFVLVGVYTAKAPDDGVRSLSLDGLRVRLFPNRWKFLGHDEDAPLGELQRAVLDETLPAISEFFLEYRPRIIHTHDMFTLYGGSTIVDALRRSEHEVTWIHDVHELVTGLSHVPPDLQAFALEHEQAYLDRPDRLLTVTGELAEELKSLYPQLPPIDVIFNCPGLASLDDPDGNTVRTRLGLQESVRLAVYSGQVKPKRGVDLLIRSLGLLPDVHLAIVSNNKGQYVADLKSLAEEVGCDDRVHWLPYVASDQVANFLVDADVGLFALEHYGNAEVCLPNKLFEYLLAGLPVATSDCRALRHFVEKYGVGSVFNPDDVDDLARAVREVLDHRQKYLEAVRGCDDLRGIYAWENQTRKLLGLYLSGVGKTDFEVLDINWRARRARRDVSPESSVSSGGGPRVLHGLAGSAGQPGTLARALRARSDLHAESLLLVLPSFGYSADVYWPLRSLAPDSTAEVCMAVLDLYDVFHFHFRAFFYDFREFGFPSGQDLLLLKAMGKRVVVHFRGGEARLQSEFRKLSPYHYLDDDPNMGEQIPEDCKRRYIKFASAVADAVLVPDPELQGYVPGSRVIERAIDLNEWECVGLANGPVPVVVHAPSRRGVKGTRWVLEAVRRLEEKGLKFRFELVEGLSQADAKRVYESADIVIDQLRIGWYGVLAVEAMALGKTVVSYVRDDLIDRLPAERPLAIASPDTIENVLETLIADGALREMLAQAGRQYCERVHGANQVAERLAAVYHELLSARASIDGATAMQVLANQWADRGPRMPVLSSTPPPVAPTRVDDVALDVMPADRAPLGGLGERVGRYLLFGANQARHISLPIVLGDASHILPLWVNRPESLVLTEDGAVEYDCGSHPNIHLTYPENADFRTPPPAGFFPFAQGKEYRLRLMADAGAATVRLFIVFFDESERIGHVSFDAVSAVTRHNVTVPRGAANAIIALRLVGKGRLRLIGLEIQSV